MPDKTMLLFYKYTDEQTSGMLVAGTRKPGQ